MIDIINFKSYLKTINLSDNTISAYEKTLLIYDSLYKEINKKNLLGFKGYLIEKYKPKTVNLRIQAINKYLEFIKKDKLSYINSNNENVPENVPEKISDEEKIIKAIKSNPEITRDEMSILIGKTKKTVGRILAKSSKIIRVGPDKGGHWEIKE